MVIGAPATWSDGSVVTSSLLNVEISDQFNLVYFGGEPWEAVVPKVAALGFPISLGPGGSAEGRVATLGKTALFVVGVTIGEIAAAAFSLGTTPIYVELPASFTPRLDAFDVLNRGDAFWSAVDQSSSAQYTGRCVRTGTRFYPKTHANPAAAVQWDQPFVWDQGDTLSVYGSFELA